MSHRVQNPCITKQLDQKAPVMQQGSGAPYLLLTAAVRNGGGMDCGRCLQKGGTAASQKKPLDEGRSAEYDSLINISTL